MNGSVRFDRAMAEMEAKQASRGNVSSSSSYNEQFTSSIPQPAASSSQEPSNYSSDIYKRSLDALERERANLVRHSESVSERTRVVGHGLDQDGLTTKGIKY